MDWQALATGLLSVAIMVISYLYRELKTKTDKTHEDFLVYKTDVATHYVSNDKLTEVVGNLNRNVESVAAGVLRIETRLNNQIDSRAAR